MATLSPALPPNPSLLAILLVIRTRSGQPRLVFHYPPTPTLSSTTQTAPPAHASWYGGASTGADDDTSSSDQSSDSDDDRSAIGGRSDGEFDEKRSKTGSWKSRRDGSKQHTGTSARLPSGRRDIDDELETGSGDEDGRNILSPDRNTGRVTGDGSEQYQPDWERVLGFDVNALSNLLTPTRAFNKRRFEIGIDNLVFLGAPMFLKADGTWKKQKKLKIKAKKRISLDQDEEIEDTSQDTTNGKEVDPDTDIDLISGFEAAYGHGLVSGAASALASEVASINEIEIQMNMFHIVFVMNPPALEYCVRVDDMYDHVVKKLAKFLKHEQARRNFVWEESIKILSMKDKAKENRATSIPVLSNAD